MASGTDTQEQEENSLHQAKTLQRISVEGPVLGLQVQEVEKKQTGTGDFAILSAVVLCIAA